MAKLIDALLCQQRWEPFPQLKGVTDPEMFEACASWCRASVEKSEVVVADNVARYMYEGTAQEQWDIYTDFPCVMPPFPATWVEYKIPSVSVSEEFGELHNPRWRLGVLFLYRAYDATDDKGLPCVGGTISCTLFAEIFGRIYGPIMGEVLGLNAEYAPVPLTPGSSNVVRPFFGVKSALLTERHRAAIESMAFMFKPAQMALVFMNCRNTVVVEHSPEKKLSKVFQKRNGRPMLRYRTLEIEPVKRILEAESYPGVSLKRALHISRGHFKDFREHGLFGRNKGIYWWGPQVRGTIERGAVVKDYSVKH